MQKNNISKSPRFFLIPVLLVLILPACAEELLPPPDLPETLILSRRRNWVVVSLPYLPIYATDHIESDVLAIVRRGDVFEVLEQSLRREFLYSREDHWYFLRNAEGWAFGAGLYSFSTREEAQNAAYRLETGEGFLNIPTWLLLLLPPILGAIIGYVTNALAIRMLFRPLEKKYIFGKIPIPLTPGVIPRQRGKLAQSIARMVSRSLFNAEVIIRHIRGEGFQNALRVQLSELIRPKSSADPPAQQPQHPLAQEADVQQSGKHASAEQASANSASAEQASAEQASAEQASAEQASAEQASAEQVSAEQEINPREFIHSRIEQFEQLILPVLKGPLGKGILSALFQWAGKRLGSLSLNTLFPLNMRNSDDLATFFREQLEGKSFRKISMAIVLWLRRREEENAPISRFLSRDRLTVGLFDKFYIPAINLLLSFLRRSDIRLELIRRGKVILSDILMKLNPVQRIVVSAGQYDRTLAENMPSIVTDLIKTLERTLRARHNREKILAALHDFLERLLQMGFKDLEHEYGLSLSHSAYRLLGRLRKLLIQEGFAECLAEQISKRREGISVNKLLYSYSKMTLDGLLMKLYQIIIEWITDSSKREQFKAQLTAIILKLREGSPAQVRGDLPESMNLAGALAKAITIFFEGAVPSLVERFNIYQMVVDRINALHVKEVRGSASGHHSPASEVHQYSRSGPGGDHRGRSTPPLKPFPIEPVGVGGG